MFRNIYDANQTLLSVGMGTSTQAMNKLLFFIYLCQNLPPLNLWCRHEMYDGEFYTIIGPQLHVG